MSSKKLWRPFAAANCKIATSLLKRNGNEQTPSIVVRTYAKSSADLNAELNKPLKYTTSPAHDWKASHSRIGSKAEFGPWYEPHVVSASLIAFMVYFFVLREENDLDLLLDKPLTDTLKEN